MIYYNEEWMIPDNMDEINDVNNILEKINSNLNTDYNVYVDFEFDHFDIVIRKGEDDIFHSENGFGFTRQYAMDLARSFKINPYIYYAEKEQKKES